MWTYKLYGLILCSQRTLLGLWQISSSDFDLELHLECLPSEISSVHLAEKKLWYSNQANDPDDVNLLIWSVANGAYFQFCYSDGTEFFIRQDTKEVWANWPQSLSLEDTLTYFLGPVMGFILRLRGTLGLHASAIVHNGKAFALLGYTGAGKSTTAAAFAKLGFKVLSDDLAALDIHDGAYWILPGYPYIRLWPESAEILFGSKKALPRLTPTWDKCYFELMPSTSFQSQSAPLAAIYLLDERTDIEPSVTLLPAREGLITLIANTNANYLLNKDMRAKEFSVLSQMVADIPLRRIKPHTDATRLDDLCWLIVKDFEMVCNPTPYV